MGKNKPVLVFDEHRDLISMYASAKEASIVLGVTPRSISNCCKGISIMCKGRYLRYLHPNVRLSTLDYFEAINLTQYDEMCGETRLYFRTKYDQRGGRIKVTAEEIKLLESNLKNKALHQLNEYYAHNLKILAEYGWFMAMNPDMYFPELLEKKLEEKKDIDLICKTLIKYYQIHLTRIIKEICNRYPEMSDFIKDSAILYKSGYIRHAILGMLSHVDGICNYKLNQQFFAKDRKFIPKIVSDLLKVKNDFFKVFITPLLSDCPIFAQQSKIDNYPSKLNRHIVVHAKDINYGSKENFLKSVSLLWYVSDMLYFSDICTTYKKSFERFIYPIPYE